jgi:hypothetical protein
MCTSRPPDADIAPGEELKPLIERLFDNPVVSYLHAHYAPSLSCHLKRHF